MAVDDRRPRARRPRRRRRRPCSARSACMRILDKTRAVIELPALGMPPETLRALLRPHPLAVRHGDLRRARPARARRRRCTRRSPRSTTTTINVMTIEDPVEYVFPTINQIQINEQAGLTFANGLRSILRQDPDAILVGEIRDVETARIAVQAALTGHFVISSLHATDATVGVAPLPRHGHRAVPDRVVAARRRRPAPRAPRSARTAPSRTRRRPRSSRSTSAAAATPDKDDVRARRRAATSAATPATSTASASTRCSPSPTR